ncbi:hypothetical protein M885DRAFT_622718 [Pelagophyceae sp. CCMP2097]|nr:hypothetical protein M885DRAFT_622718 [Pelagophyceae sp. CCMP2097]
MVALPAAVRVVAYRVAIACAGAASAGDALCAFAQDQGLGFSAPQDLAALGTACGAAAALAAPCSAEEPAAAIEAPALRLAAVLALAALALPGLAPAGLAPDLQHFFADGAPVARALPFFLVCVRECFYFGAAYKVEALIFMALAPLRLDQEAAAAPAIRRLLDGASAVALLVLAAGKAFEPLDTDLAPTGSVFFLDAAAPPAPLDAAPRARDGAAPPQRGVLDADDEAR